MRINKNTTIGALLEAIPEAADILTNMGMHCIGCPSAQGESLEEACMVHGLDADVVLKSIQDYLAKK